MTTMKKILFFPIFLMPIFLSAQIVSDTSYVVTENSVQYYVTVQSYADGTVSTLKQPKTIAQTDAVERFKKNLATEAASMVNNCAVVNEFDKHLRRLNKEDSELKALTGVSCLSENEASYRDAFAGTWTLEQFKSPTTVTISINQNGKLRWSSGGNGGGMTVYAEGVISLNNWAGKQNLNLYSISSNVWENLGGTITFKKS